MGVSPPPYHQTLAPSGKNPIVWGWGKRERGKRGERKREKEREEKDSANNYWRLTADEGQNEQVHSGSSESLEEPVGRAGV